MADLNENYRQFLKWFKEVGRVENEEKNPILKKQLTVKKSVFAELVYEKYMNTMKEILISYSELFQNKLILKMNSKVNPFNIMFMPDGMRLMAEKFKVKGTFPEDVVICESYEDYHEQLKQIKNQDAGEWYFGFRCQSPEDPENIHQTLVTVTKLGEQFEALLLDSGGFNGLFADGSRIATLTHETLPNVKMISTFCVRQRDESNCGFIVLKDIKTIVKARMLIMNETKSAAKNVQKDKIQRPIKDHIIQNITFAEDLYFLLNESTQSLSQLNNIIKKIKEQNGESLSDEFIKFELKKKIFTVVNIYEGSEMYAYTKFNGVKYRMQIIADTFASQH